MKRNLVVTTVVILLLVIIAGAGSFLWVSSFGKSEKAKPIATPTEQPYTPYVDNRPTLEPGTKVAPTPGIERKEFHSNKNGYTVEVPMEWKVNEHEDNVTGGTILRGFYKFRTGPNTYPFEMSCRSNPEHLDAEGLFNKSFPEPSAEQGEKGIGLVTLTSGIQAYVSVGYGGQQNYKSYTITNETKDKQCAFLGFIYGFHQPNADIIISIINTFRWTNQ